MARESFLAFLRQAELTDYDFLLLKSLKYNFFEGRLLWLAKELAVLCLSVLGKSTPPFTMSPLTRLDNYYCY